LFTFIPLAIYFLYSYIDTKRRKEQKEKLKIKNAFKQYVMPAIIDEMLKDPSKLKLGGEKKNLTILFSDIRGFTTLSEKLGPEKLVHLLNEYLTAMTDIVLENRGVVDKFIGDAIMAFWNAPLDDPEHTALSVRTAVLMIETLEKCNKNWQARGFPEVKIGIGLNSGQVIVGNMGSEQRFDYTCLGDHVNLASRLEGLTKYYGASIIISESVYGSVKEKFIIRELDNVIVKGKTVPIKIYEVLTDYSEANLKTWHNALDSYRKKRFSAALADFQKLPKDKASEMYVERCNTFMKNPPPADWNGVYTMKTK
jgi:adenylate cyclase